jgi:CheY-like chemotaxis protein
MLLLERGKGSRAKHDAMSKTALVVDDSVVARHVLTKLLSEHGVSAESAESAELALEYLKHRRPDVVFMDHMMPGMDGFQALEAIKANPATATIPVMMYTSQEGELYVGQARALGAFGVLPKDLKPVEVARVLKALHLIPGDRAEDRDWRAARSEQADSRRTRELIEELFHQQRSALREEIREGYERAFASTQTQLQPIAPPAPVVEQWHYRPFALAAVFFAALAVTFGYLYFAATGLLEENTRRSAELIASSAELSDASARALGSQSRGVATDPSFVELIEWALNSNNAYGFDEIPLSEERAEHVRRAIEYAGRVGFDGRLLLRVHVGQFCMSFGPDGAAEVAAPTIPITQCEQLGWLPSEAFAMGRRQTLGFANIVVAAASDTNVRIETASAGGDEPVVAYPAITEALLAGEWNSVAARNHRIEYRLVPNDRAPANARP